MNSSFWNPHELPVLPYSKIVSRKETTVSAELTENWILNEIFLKTFLRRGGFYGFYRFYWKKEMKIKTIIIIIIIIFIMIVIIYLILLFREIRCIQPKSRVSSLIPSLKFLFPLSPRNSYCPLVWNTTLVSIISLFRWKDFPDLTDLVDFFSLFYPVCFSNRRVMYVFVLI